jgi:hypothetical protein
MSKGIRRLNRRRYRESVAALKEIIADKKTPPARRLHAIETLLGIFDRHDRTELQKEARKRASDAPQDAGQTIAPPEAPESAEERAERFLQRFRAQRESTTNGN